jgi:hypothetical protein
MSRANNIGSSPNLSTLFVDRCNDDTQGSDPYKVKGQELHPCCPGRHEDPGTGCETPVHQHRHEHAPSAVVHPHHEHSEERQEEKCVEQVAGEREGPGNCPARPQINKEVPRCPQHGS